MQTPSHQHQTSNAKLFMLVGPSGCGKDSLLAQVRVQLCEGTPLLFAHRYITRCKNNSEDHISLSTLEFEQRKQQGLFTLHWKANNCQYAIGREIDLWLNAGQNVIFNGSREHILQAHQRFGDALRVIWIEVSPEILRQRLEQRKRESTVEIEQRLHRNQQQQANKNMISQQLTVVTLDNSGPFTVAVQRLQHLVYQHQESLKPCSA
ncbi:phosphonate metabolism protein/1,5-bisphosphokinase (PRPP-forming) PhnN [Alginatibacterium sediminis]|uniref:ribose 1,5-bisphosphate phosphokinase n=1 Tax=Alginatibacterium sediminis TaxID=2164068 RepID=A0A420EL69_9ALTE|nr:phosphonate metabolism protein/1,5-bisphosphokinase (PRPP-forming) PhnN [Alginatibacterium sediminis]RKF21438.1 phosphonate metabolism protein/1,5-bisphosphokinase (PRPP-forming) PhnN [Alginatibacterium sediminis]